MIRALIKKIIRQTWRALPLRAQQSIIRICILSMTEKQKFRVGIPSAPGLLENIKDNGVSPLTIVDIGANVGDWARMACSVFPSSRILMFDGNPENDFALQNAVREIGIGSKHSICLLGREKRDAVTFFQMGTGSSVLPELTAFERNPVSLPMNTLDNMFEETELRVPLLLKLDVQGFELEVLEGGRRTLSLADVVILESSLLQYNEGAPLFAEVVALMSNEGFVVFDFCGQNRRESDGVLFQTDIAFVRRQSPLRAQRRFWLREPEAASEQKTI
jgi:FkbM family methyltransferase